MSATIWLTRTTTVSLLPKSSSRPPQGAAVSRKAEVPAEAKVAQLAADVARAARVSHGTVFVHFPTRDDMVAAVVEVLGYRITRKLHECA